ncbi:MAG: PepSY domain-containing protein [Solirubrobacterales bacterium]
MDLRLAAALAAIALLALPAAAAADGPDASGRITYEQAVRIADREPKVVAERAEHPDLSSSASIVDGNWEVGYFSDGEEVALVLVDPVSGLVKESWTGYQVAWKMARGYSGAFGHRLNAPYVFIPLCALFLVGLVDWRRPLRIANLDLVVLLGFTVSHFFFNRAEIGVSVPLAYPPLLYLLARMLWIGFRGYGRGIAPVWPASWLVIGALFLLGFRVGLNLADSGVIDVGYAGVVGADRVADGKSLYGDFPADVSQGDTYGPVNYYAYVPFEQAFPWSGEWDDLPAGHAAAVFFDLAAVALIALLGYRMRRGPPGVMLGATLAFAWAAYPYTAYVLESNSNDSLVAVLLIATLLLAARPAARGATLALATFTKFAPLLLAPMLATLGDRDGRRRVRSAGLFAAGFLAVSALVMAQTAIDPGLHTFYERTIAYQAGRDSPFSIWGQVGLEPLRVAILVLAGALSVLFAFVPRRKSLLQVSALGAALLIALQLAAQHWFYLYIVWFLPLVLVAIAGREGSGGPGSGPDQAGESTARPCSAAPSASLAS